MIFSIFFAWVPFIERADNTARLIDAKYHRLYLLLRL